MNYRFKPFVFPILSVFLSVLLSTHTVAQSPSLINGGGLADGSRSVYDQVSFTFHNVPLKEALATFTNRTGIVLVYSLDSERLSKPVSAVVLFESPIAALRKILTGSGLDMMLANSGRIVLVPQLNFTSRPGTLQGAVTDQQTGKPIPSVNIYLKELLIGTTTDSEGEFELGHIPPGAYTIRATHVSYETEERQIAVSDSRQLVHRLSLNPAVLQIGEIFIDDLNPRQHNGGLGVSGTRIEQDQIDRTGGMWIGQVLRSRVAGLTFFENGMSSGGGYLQFRGVGSFHNPSDYMRINVDGIPVDGIYWETFITDNLSRIEVLRGPQASGRYGASAMSGVINLYTDTGREGPMHASISAAGGLAKSSSKRFDPFWQEYFGSIGGGNEIVSSGITIRHTRDDGILVNHSSRMSAVTAGTKIQPGEKVAVRATFRFTELLSGWPYAQNIRSMAMTPIINPEVSSRQQRGIGSLNFDVDLYSWWEQSVILGTEYLQGILDYTVPEPYTGGDLYRFPRQSENISERDIHLKPTLHYNTRFIVPVGETERGTFSAGIEVQREDRSRDVQKENDDVFERLFKNRTEQMIVGKYLSWSFKSSENFDVTFGIRMDQIQARGEVFTYPISPSLNLGYRFKVTDSWIGILRGSIGRGIRHPHYSMIFGQAPIEVPNPELRAEIMDGWETGFTQYMLDGKISVTATYFSQETRDAFQQETITGAQAAYRWINAGRVTNRGLELEAFIVPIEWFQFGLAHSFHWNRAVEIIGGNSREFTLLRVPNRAGSFFFALQPINTFILNADIYYVGERIDNDLHMWAHDGRIFHISQYERVFDSFVKVDVSGKYTAFESYELFVNVFNFFNDLTREYGGYLPAGRMVIVGVRYTI